MSKLNQRVELVANLILIVVTIILGVVLVRQFFLSPSAILSQNQTQEALQSVNTGPIEIQGVNFSEQKKTLILALQAGCHFCADSAPFYKRLIENNKDKNIKIVAVLPSSTQESEDYIKGLGIKDLEVKQASLGSLQVRGTPTLILANEKGEVINSWVGKLPDFKEEEVLKTVFQ
jgi:thioredoxin-related protein